MDNTYDTIIIWAWAAWLFTAIQAPFSSKKLILEKTARVWQKVLLSGWERANVSNADIEATRDYFGQNRKAMISLLSRYSNWDIQSFFAENWVSIIEEDRQRLILESWDSRELLNLLVKKAKGNGTDIKINSEVVSIKRPVSWETGLEVLLKNWTKYHAKKVVISSGWKSFYQIWTTWDWYNLASDLWIKIIKPHRWLCWLTTREDLSELSWVSTNLNLELVDKEKTIYRENWPLLFTHFWVSWPIIFNTAVALGEHLNKLGIKEENEKDYLKNNIFIKLKFDLEWSPKRIIKFFNLSENKVNWTCSRESSLGWNLETKLNILDWRSWKEAKVTWWWVSLDELGNNLQSKKIPWLYFCWEILDLTWKTWGFNLQIAWSSWFVVWKNL